MPGPTVGPERNKPLFDQESGGLKGTMAIRLRNQLGSGLLILGVGSMGLSGCQEELPTLIDDDLFPVDAVTVEVRIPFEEFASDLSVWGGYGSPFQLPTVIVARNFEGILDARTLVNFFPFPPEVSVRDTTGSVRPDTLLTYPGGRLVARIDTTSSVAPGPVTLALSAPDTIWHFGSVTWSLAVDTVGDQRAWQEEGAGPATPLGTAVWDPTQGDSVVFELDSAAVALWGDAPIRGRGARIEALTEGVRLDISSIRLSVDARASINPDTVVASPVGVRFRTFVYSPELSAPENAILVGGVPAWRTVLRLSIPDTLNGPASLCAQVVCPVALEPEALTGASLVLRTQAPPAAFQPTDSLLMDVRPVLSPDRLPKAPLGSSLAGSTGVLLVPDDFGEQDGVEVEIPLNAYVRSLLAANSNPDLTVPPDLALLSAFEPLSLYFASFYGPDTPLGPELLLVLTFGEEVGIR
jgi:hypothetical protein